MAKQVRDARVLLKRLSTPGVIPKLGPGNDHTTGWSSDDIYRGELFLNMVDNRMWVITDNTANPHEIPMYNGNNLNLKGNIYIDGLPSGTTSNILYYDDTTGDVTWGTSAAVSVDLSGSTATTSFTITNTAGNNAVIPGATNTYAGLITTGNQTFSGNKTINGDILSTLNITANFNIIGNQLIVGNQTNKAIIRYITDTARTLTIPDLGGNRTFSFIQEPETFEGVKTFQVGLVLGSVGPSTNGGLRFNGGDFQGRRGGVWETFLTDNTANVVTTDTTQTITGQKTFSNGLILGDSSITTNGGLRFDGTNFQGRRGGVWETFLTSGNVVTIDTTQTITGQKTFSNALTTFSASAAVINFSGGANKTIQTAGTTNLVLSPGGITHTSKKIGVGVVDTGDANELISVIKNVSQATGIDGAYIKLHNNNTTSSDLLFSGIKFQVGAMSSSNKPKGSISFKKTSISTTEGRGELVFSLNDDNDLDTEVTYSDRKMIIQRTGRIVISPAIADNGNANELLSVLKSAATSDGSDGAFIKLHNTVSQANADSFTGIKFQVNSSGTSNNPKGAIFYKKVGTTTGNGTGQFIFSLNTVANNTGEALEAHKKLVINNNGNLDIYGNINLSEDSNKTISPMTRISTGAGVNLTVKGGNGNSGNGGNLLLTGGDAGSFTSGDVYIFPGNALSAGNVFLGHTSTTARGKVGIGTTTIDASSTLTVDGGIKGEWFYTLTGEAVGTPNIVNHKIFELRHMEIWLVTTFESHVTSTVRSSIIVHGHRIGTGNVTATQLDIGTSGISFNYANATTTKIDVRFSYSPGSGTNRVQWSAIRLK